MNNEYETRVFFDLKPNLDLSNGIIYKHFGDLNSILDYEINRVSKDLYYHMLDALKYLEGPKFKQAGYNSPLPLMDLNKRETSLPSSELLYKRLKNKPK